MPDSNADVLHLAIDLTECEYTFYIYHPFTGAQVAYTIDDFTIDFQKNQLISQATFDVPFSGNNIVNGYALAKILNKAPVEFFVTHRGSVEDVQRLWIGRIDSIDPQSDKLILTCFDFLADLKNFSYNFNVFEATRIKLVGQESLPTPPDDVSVGILVVPVTENSVLRYIIPAHLDLVDGSTNIAEYEKSYSGGSAATPYDYSSNHNGWYYKGSTNRRSWRSIGRVYDTGMDLYSDFLADGITPNPNKFGQKQSYNYTGSDSDFETHMPIPRNFYQVGTDVATYLEILPGYTVCGDIYIEWIEVYVEGTNDIEQIVQKLINPRLTGTCTSGSSAGTIVSDAARFVSTGVLVGGKIKISGTDDSLAETITEITQQYELTTDGSQSISWADGFSYEIFDAIETAPRWKDTIHFNLSGDYADRTIWPSLITINSIKWNRSDGTAFDFFSTLFSQYAVPNYRPIWDHAKNMLRMQFTEVTPYDSATTYFEQGSLPYGAFKDPSAMDSGGVGTDEFHSLKRVNKDVSAPRDAQTLFSCVTTEGVNEHNQNMLISGEAKMWTMAPGTAPTGWNYSGSLSQTWTCVRRNQDDYTSAAQTYADIADSGFIDMFDQNVDTGIAWVSPSTPPKQEAAQLVPVYVIDLGHVQQIQAIHFTTLWSKENSPFMVKLECCDEDGIAITTGQVHHNPSASWSLMDSDWAGKSIMPFISVEVTNLAVTTCRYILVSMGFAKIHDKKTHALGLAELSIFSSDTVTGQARITDMGHLRAFDAIESVNNASPDGTHSLLTNSAGDFITKGVTVGDEIFNVTQGFATTISARTATTVTAVNNGDASLFWIVGDYYTIRPIIYKTGQWIGYQGTGLDDALYLLNMPLLYQILVGVNGADYGSTAVPHVGQLDTYFVDHSITNSNGCAIRSAEFLIQTIRQFISVSGSAKWHNAIRLYHTAKVYHYPTGTIIRGLVESIKFTRQGISFSVTNYAPGAFTGEIADPVPTS